MTVQEIVDRNVSNNVGRSTFDFLLATGTYVEAKFGTAGLSATQRRAAQLLGDDLLVYYWTYPTVTAIVAAGVGAAAAGGDSSKEK